MVGFGVLALRGEFAVCEFWDEVALDHFHSTESGEIVHIHVRIIVLFGFFGTHFGDD